MRLIMRQCVGVNVDVDTAFCFVIVVKKLLTVNRKMKQAKTCRLSAPLSLSLPLCREVYLGAAAAAADGLTVVVVAVWLCSCCLHTRRS